METLHATEPLRVGGVVLIAIQRTRVDSSREFGGFGVSAFAAPRALVIEEGGRWRALDLEGGEIPVEPLLEQVPGLTETVERERARRGSKDTSG